MYSDARLPIFLLAHRASTPVNLVFGRDLQLPCNELFGAPPDKEQLTIDHAANLVDHLHSIHNYGRQHLLLASDRMKTH
jgi:hypothetical protein